MSSIKKNTKFFSHEIHVLFKREELEDEVLENKVVVVLDILFATTTIITAFANGVKIVIPVRDEASARAEAKRHAENSYVLAGELYAQTITGFASPSPLALRESPLDGKTLIYSTTNGTVALKQAASASHVFVGSLINAKAIVSRISELYPRKPVLIVCSGSMGLPNLEDSFGAGYFVDLFMKNRKKDITQYSDAALAARQIFISGKSNEILLTSRVGRLMIERGKKEEVNYAAQLSVLEIVPKLTSNKITI